MRTNLFFTFLAGSRVKHTLFTSFLLLTLSHAALAQISTQGEDFYLSFGGRSINISRPNVLPFLIKIAAPQAADVTLTFTEDGSTVPLHVNAGAMITYRLDAEKKELVHSDVTGVSNKSLRIQSTTPVSVYAINQMQVTTDATHVLPVPALGTVYFQLSYQGQSIPPNETYTNGLYSSDGYTVVATENNTRIYEDGTLRATIDAGQVYSAYYLAVDATGRRITSSRPIACFATNQSAFIPTSISFADVLYEQMAPVNSWGNTFIVPATRRGIERVRILASQDGTAVTQTGGVIKTDGGGGAQNPANPNAFTLDAGQYVELEITLAGGGCYISAGKPVAVASYLVGEEYPGLTVTNGDPSQAWVPPVEQMIPEISIAPFVVPATPGLIMETVVNEHHALIVTETATRDQTKVSINNGTLGNLSGGAWRTGNGAGNTWSFYSMPLGNALYYFYNPNGLTVMGYGLGPRESYSYLAGAAFRNLNAAFYVNDIHHQDVNGMSFCEPAFSIRGNTPGQVTWYIDGTEQTVAENLLEWSATLAPGSHTIRMDVTDLDNQPHTATATFTVLEMRMNAPADLVDCIGSTVPQTTFTSSTSGFTYTWTNDNPSLGLPASGTGNQPAFTALHTGSATITVTPHLGDCIGTPQTYTIKVSSCVLPVNPHLMGRFRGN
jgi:hypothetical protein